MYVINWCFRNVKINIKEVTEMVMLDGVYIHTVDCIMSMSMSMASVLSASVKYLFVVVVVEYTCDN